MFLRQNALCDAESCRYIRSVFCEIVFQFAFASHHVFPRFCLCLSFFGICYALTKQPDSHMFSICWTYVFLLDMCSLDICSILSYVSEVAILLINSSQKQKQPFPCPTTIRLFKI